MNYQKGMLAGLGLLTVIGLTASLTFASEQTGTIDTGTSTGLGGTVVAAPSFSPAAGTYTATQSVTITAAGSTAVCYRTDSTDPSCSTSDAALCGSGSTKYTGAISVSSTTAFRARSCYPGDGGVVVFSSVSSATYTISGGGGSSSGGGGGGGGSTLFSPNIVPTEPASLEGNKLSNQTVTCRANDFNTTNPGLNMNAAVMKINGVAVTPTLTVVNANGNSNTNSSVVKMLDFSYTPDSAHLYADPSSVSVSCSIKNNNNLLAETSFSFNVNSSAPGAGPGTGSFTDTSGHWAQNDVERLKTECNVQGYTDAAGMLLHLFKPDSKITRAELITMLVKCKMGVLAAPDTDPFPDVPKSHWAAPYIAKAKELGTVMGYPSGVNAGKFLPNQNATRAEALKMILLTYFDQTMIDAATSSSVCTDLVSGQWYLQYFYLALNKGIVKGMNNPDGTPTGLCAPSSAVTRAESAAMIIRSKDMVGS